MDSTGPVINRCWSQVKGHTGRCSALSLGFDWANGKQVLVSGKGTHGSVGQNFPASGKQVLDSGKGAHGSLVSTSLGFDWANGKQAPVSSYGAHGSAGQDFPLTATLSAAKSRPSR